MALFKGNKIHPPTPKAQYLTYYILFVRVSVDITSGDFTECYMLDYFLDSLLAVASYLKDRHKSGINLHTQLSAVKHKEYFQNVKIFL